ncbi:MAG: amidohydrolase family protein [Spirochaetaceae bacterium]|nr:amidohydrolase family protein [Spirochaetaceae bacterium]
MDPHMDHPIVDCDVHVYPRDPEELQKYLPLPWKHWYRGESRPFYQSKPPLHGSRQDAFAPGGGRPGTDPDTLRRQLIDQYGIRHAILLPRVFANMYPDPDYATALARAFNDWLADTWLTAYNADGCFRGSLNVAQQDPHAAAAEIERIGGHEYMVQVMVDSGARAPFGQRQYHPIYEQCEKLGLPFAIHPGTDGAGINAAPTPGYPTHLVEWHTLLSLGFQAHLVSFITEGVFERYPGLTVVLVEGGVAWLAPLIWRLTDHWRSMRTEVPWMDKPPLHYLHRNVRLTTQPMENPDDPAHLAALLRSIAAHRVLMYSSDYPHFDFDSPTVIARHLPADMHEAVFHANAARLYRLPLPPATASDRDRASRVDGGS